MTKRHLRIDDLPERASSELTEDDVQKITGGALLATAPNEVGKIPGPPAPPVPTPFPNIATVRTR